MSGRVHARVADESIGPLFGELLEDGKAFATAEVELFRAGLRLRIARAKAGIVLAVVALAILHLFLIAGTVMLAIALATLVGPLASGLIVLAFGSALALVLARMASVRIKRGFAPLPEEGA